MLTRETTTPDSPVTKVAGPSHVTYGVVREAIVVQAVSTQFADHRGSPPGPPSEAHFGWRCVDHRNGYDLGWNLDSCGDSDRDQGDPSSGGDDLDCLFEQCHWLIGPVDSCDVDLRFDVGEREGEQPMLLVDEMRAGFESLR